MVEWRRGHPIGRGSSATVSLATNLQSGELFAVKSVEFSDSHRLRREQSILSSLNSPFVISCLGSDISRDASNNQLCYNMFMELATGGSLSDKIRRSGGRFDEPSIRFHTYRILSGLTYLHKNGIIHSDIKGQNVLIDSDGNSKIADFGCARRDCTEKQYSQSCGTPMYMAPEVARGEEQGAPADVWALGCTVIEMATGGIPWPGFSDLASIIHHIAHSSDVPVVPDSISDEARDFLNKCLVRDSKLRWSAEKLLEHPFVASSENSVSEKSPIQSRVSPKSILDQEIWQSISIDWKEELAERIEILAGDEIDGPDWSMDESWINVRSNGGEEEIATLCTSDHGFDFVNFVNDAIVSCERDLEIKISIDNCCCDSVSKSKEYCFRFYDGDCNFFHRYFVFISFSGATASEFILPFLHWINCRKVLKSFTNLIFRLQIIYPSF